MTNLDAAHQTRERIEMQDRVKELERRVPAVCPSCNGEGVVTNVAGLEAGIPEPFEKCLRCDGRGAIWEVEKDEDV